MNAEVPGSTASPIADTSYRNYDGPLRPPRFGWWIVARMMARLSLKRKGFWVLLFFCMMPYLMPTFLLYIKTQDPTGRLDMLLGGSIPSLFYDAYAYNQIWLLLLALLVGAGSIAGDNRANALQIYLSKPLTKTGYLLGKWLGIFSVLAAASLLPAVLLYLYCWGSFAGQGFLRQNPWLWLQVLATGLMPPLFHSSAILGLSAWLKRPLQVGGIYASIFFGSHIVAGILYFILRRSGEEAAVTALHCSVPGVLRGLGQHLLGVKPGFYGLPIRMGMFSKEFQPDLAPVLILMVALSVTGVLLARARVRAVEVVRG